MKALLALLLGASLLAAGGPRFRQGTPGFAHPKHAKLFVTCATCHAGVVANGAALFPDAGSCARCHDGTVTKRVEWTPRSGPRPSNLRFDHLQHARGRVSRRDTTEICADCHAERGAGWMTVRGPSAPQCLSCHLPRTEHLAAPDSACATCHLTLAQATALPLERIAKLPIPASHRAADFLLTAGHGVQARQATRGNRPAASCATCHARDFCASCHVDAPELAAIQALASDSRSLAVRHELKAPASHRLGDFETRHGRLAAKSGATCATCHTQESCLECHRGEASRPVLALHRAGPGRGAGARVARRAPATHNVAWREGHGPFAAASLQSCASCHARTECLSCHLPNAARRNSYHPASYLTRHPADAYSRSSSCADCHNTGEFCQRCHQQSGVTARRTLLGAGGYHDGNRRFFIGHGQAARQSLESCVSCHVERDCLTCHSVVKGRGFNPHGPGFDPERMLRKNPQLCIACHGTAIPRRGPAP